MMATKVMVMTLRLLTRLLLLELACWYPFRRSSHVGGAHKEHKAINRGRCAG